MTNYYTPKLYVTGNTTNFEGHMDIVITNIAFIIDPPNNRKDVITFQIDSRNGDFPLTKTKISDNIGYDKVLSKYFINDLVDIIMEFETDVLYMPNLALYNEIYYIAYQLSDEYITSHFHIKKNGLTCHSGFKYYIQYIPLVQHRFPRCSNGLNSNTVFPLVQTRTANFEDIKKSKYLSLPAQPHGFDPNTSYSSIHFTSYMLNEINKIIIDKGTIQNPNESIRNESISLNNIGLRVMAKFVKYYPGDIHIGPKKQFTCKYNMKLYMPDNGFSTCELKNVYDDVLSALLSGRRHIICDGEYRYTGFSKKLQLIGQAIKDSKIPRKNIFLTTKIQSSINPEHFKRAYEKTLVCLDTDYVDLLLLNQYNKSTIIENWKIMEELYFSKKCNHIGVSDFWGKRIKFFLTDDVNIIPSVVYNEQQADETSFDINVCVENEIKVILKGDEQFKEGMVKRNDKDLLQHVIFI